jgi:hypothetical protein
VVEIPRHGTRRPHYLRASMNGGHSEALKRRTTVMAQQRGVIAMITTIGVGGLRLAMLGLELHSGLLLIALMSLVVAAQVDLHSRRLPNRLLAAASMPAGLAVVAAHGVTLTAVVSALAGVRQEWASYQRVLADDWGGGEPAPELVALRRELLTR